MSANFDEGGPAFPRPASIDTSSGTLPDGDTVIAEQRGMTLRDWFAGQSLAMLARVYVEDFKRDEHFENWAKRAYQMADAMLVERAQ